MTPFPFALFGFIRLCKLFHLMLMRKEYWGRSATCVFGRLQNVELADLSLNTRIVLDKFATVSMFRYLNVDISSAADVLYQAGVLSIEFSLSLV
jgi:hypothetical protein